MINTLIDSDPELFEPIGNACPECEARGSVVIYHSAVRCWETGEYPDSSEEPCLCCDGLGYLTEPDTADAPWWEGIDLGDRPDEDAFTQALRFTITRH